MRNQPAGVNDSDSASDWFKSIPIVTKTLVSFTFLFGALSTFGLINPGILIFDINSIKNKFQIWRLITPFLFAGGFSLPFAMHCYMLYENCKRYEAHPFNTGGGGTSADFIYMVIFGMIIFYFAAYFFEMPILAEPLLYHILYVWTRREPEAKVNIFGFKFQSLYLPWVYIGIRMIMGGSITQPLIGISVGHLYYFLVEVLPNSHDYDLIKTPKFCVSIFNWYTGITSAPPPAFVRGGGVPPTNAPRAMPGFGSGYQWGTGRTLGTN